VLELVLEPVLEPVGRAVLVRKAAKNLDAVAVGVARELANKLRLHPLDSLARAQPLLAPN